MDRDKELVEIKCDVKEIYKMLRGNGQLGVAEMARRAFEGYTHCKKSKNGLFDWTFRLLISIILLYIAAEVGLR